VVGYVGETLWDTTKPEGTPQKLLDVSILADAGWTSKISLREGIERTVAWYRDHKTSLRT
jgi:GDP-L-fucose synthase